jgi:hypothetical protein
VRLVAYLAVLFVLLLGCSTQQPVGLASVSSTLYVRTDTDDTDVWSPRERLAGKLGESAGVEATFAIDAWTSASIDIVTAATKAVHEVRKEINGGAYYAFPNATISGGYRYSTEEDYWSHGGVTNLAVDMASNNTTLGVTLFGSKDVVGRANDRWYKKPQSSIGGRLSLTQVLDKKSVIELSVETTRVVGFQASPYRTVAVNETGVCRELPSERMQDELTLIQDGCTWEAVPDERMRSAALLRGRRALGDHFSAGLNYRFYFDDWGVLSHAIAPDVRLLVGEHGTLTADYRYYTQGEASFYRPRYLGVAPGTVPTYRTRDRELSAFYSNRLGLAYMHAFELGQEGRSILRAALRAGLTRYRYLAFVGLTRVDALEGTFLLSLDFD